jgi:hypothetical protein
VEYQVKGKNAATALQLRDGNRKNFTHGQVEKVAELKQ